MNEELIKDVMRLNYSQLVMNCVGNIEEIERLNNIINEFENRLKRRIKAYEDRQALGKGYELTNVMEIQLTIDRKYLKELQELKGDGSNE